LWDARSGALQQVVARYTRHVVCHDISPDGARIVSSSIDQKFILADPSGVEIAALNGHEYGPKIVTFSNDCRWLASTDGFSVCVWDAITGRCQASITECDGSLIRALQFEPNSERLVGMINGPVLISWDLTGNRIGVVRFFNGSENWSVEHAAISSDAASATAVTRSGQVAHWNRQRGVVTGTRFGFSSRGCEVTAFSLSSDGNQVAVSTKPKTVMTTDDLIDYALVVYHAPDLSETPLKGHTNQVEALAFSNDGTKLASGGSDQTLRVWDVKNGTELAVFSEWGEVTSGRPSSAVAACAFSDDGERVVAGSYGVAKVWAISDGQTQTARPTPNAQIESCLVAPNHQTFLTLRYSEPPIQVYRAETGELLRHLGRSKHSSYQPFAYAYSPSGNSVLLAESRQPLAIWDVEAGESNREFGRGASVANCTHCCLSPLESHVAASWQDKRDSQRLFIEIWHVATEKLINRIEDIRGRVTSLVFSPEGHLLLWCTDIAEYSLWDIEHNKLHASINTRASYESIGTCFSQDGSWLITLVRHSINDTVTLKAWDLNFRELMILPAGTADASLQVKGPMLSSDDTLLLCVVGDSLRIWPLSAPSGLVPKMIAVGPPTEIKDIQIARLSPKGDRISAVTGIGSVVILSAPGWNAIAEWCPEASRITGVEWTTNEKIVVTMADATLGLLELREG
jgi:WD40 repeat protein